MSAELINFKTVTFEPIKIIGKEVLCNFGHPEGNPIPSAWGKYHEDGTIQALQEHPERIYDNALVGWMTNFDFKQRSFTYIIGIIAKSDAVVPEGMVGLQVEEGKWAVGTIKGLEPELYMEAHCLTEEEAKKLELTIDWERNFEVEWYDERFCTNEPYKVIDLLLPIK